eukprot:364119-Chlamydomonas_euryale.AAC.4
MGANSGAQHLVGIIHGGKQLVNLYGGWVSCVCNVASMRLTRCYCMADVMAQVLEHGQDMLGCERGGSGCGGGGKGGTAGDMSSHRAALLEGAMSTTLKHPNVVQAYDFRLVNLGGPQSKWRCVCAHQTPKCVHTKCPDACTPNVQMRAHQMPKCVHTKCPDARTQNAFAANGHHNARTPSVHHIPSTTNIVFFQSCTESREGLGFPPPSPPFLPSLLTPHPLPSLPFLPSLLTPHPLPSLPFLPSLLTPHPLPSLPFLPSLLTPHPLPSLPFLPSLLTPHFFVPPPLFSAAW